MIMHYKWLSTFFTTFLYFFFFHSLESTHNTSHILEEKLTDNNQYRVSVDFCSLGKLGQSTTILVAVHETPHEVVGKALKKIHRVEGEPELSQNPYDYLLKACVYLLLRLCVLGVKIHFFFGKTSLVPLKGLHCISILFVSLCAFCFGYKLYIILA